MPKIRHTLAFAAAALVGLSGAQAQAASQVLGLVASNAIPTPLQCQDGICSGHFSSFCLQEARPAPSADSEYQLAPGSGHLTLIASLPGGHSLRLPADDLLSVHTRIGFTSVKISLPEAKLKALGAISVAVEVAPGTSILPVVVARDPNPQTPEEIAFATGPMRRLAVQPFEKPGEAADAARLTSLAINAIGSDEPGTALDRKAVFDKAVAETDGRAVTADGLAEARRIYRSCEISVDSRSSFSLKSCLEMHHADLMAVTNRNFWNTAGGS
ncbi:MAG: hypothetical protein QOK29_4216 [Rhodospirillaceae bacterium]|nr:hypothetical protein [Rhodospirillaceae bacterium]